MVPLEAVSGSATGVFTKFEMAVPRLVNCVVISLFKLLALPLRELKVLRVLTSALAIGFAFALAMEADEDTLFPRDCSEP